jgi:hypothetical protein
MPPPFVPKVDQIVRVTQTVTTREGAWRTEMVGTVVHCTPLPTESWYAHGKSDRYWLMRLRLRREDGELVELIVDDKTIVEPIEATKRAS